MVFGKRHTLRRKPQRVLNLVHQLRRNRILRCTAKAHVYEALIDGELLQHRRVEPANGNKAFRTLFIPLPVPSHNDKVRATSEGTLWRPVQEHEYPVFQAGMEAAVTMSA